MQREAINDGNRQIETCLATFNC